MLVLIKNNAVLNRLEVIGRFAEGGWVDLPDGSRVSPAVDGWSLRGYELKTIAPAEPVPDGQAIVSSSLQIINGVPTIVNVFAPVPVSIDDFKAAFDAHLDEVAQERQYDNRVSIATYATSTNPAWAAEAQAYIAWRDAALIYMFEQLATVQAGEIQPPTVAEFIAGIDPIVWPD